MFDLNPQATAAAIGGVIVGAVTLSAQFITQWGLSQGRKHDARQRDLEWFRQQLLNTYGNCIEELYRVVDQEGESEQPATRDRDLGLCQRHLLQLAAYCVDEKDRSRLEVFSKHLANSWEKKGCRISARDAAEYVRIMMWKDTRIQLTSGQEK